MIPADVPIEERMQMLVLMSSASRWTPEVQKLKNLALKRTLSPTLWAKAAAALAVIQENVPYIRHKTEDQWFQPVWLTARKGGMCADLGPLLSSVLCELGVPNRLQWINQVGASANHLTVQVWAGDELGWQYADPSIPNARVGETPYEALARSSAWDRVGMNGKEQK